MNRDDRVALRLVQTEQVPQLVYATFNKPALSDTRTSPGLKRKVFHSDLTASKRGGSTFLATVDRPHRRTNQHQLIQPVLMKEEGCVADHSKCLLSERDQTYLFTLTAVFRMLKGI